MNKTKISKIIISIITFALIVCISTNVFADDGLLDFDGDFTNSSTDSNTTDGTENNNAIENLTPSDNNTSTGENTNTNANSNANTNTNVNNSANNTTSTYEESDIPYAGPVEDMLMVVAFIIFGIIGIYTFKKLSDYSNL